MDFKDKYPLATHELLHFPLMFASSLKDMHIPGVPYASLRFLYDFGERFGISQGTVRTNLSRMKKDGYVLAVEDKGETRYRVSQLQMDQMRSFMKGQRRKGTGYTVAVYSFESAREKERNAARSLLEYVGFVRFAQNAFIKAGNGVTEIRAALIREGLSGNVFLFTVTNLDPEDATRLARAWDIPARAKFLGEYLADQTAFLEGASSSEEEAFCRVGYAWVSFITHVQSSEPPLPNELLPADYAFDKIHQNLMKANTRLGKGFYSYYVKSNRKEK